MPREPPATLDRQPRPRQELARFPASPPKANTEGNFDFVLPSNAL